MQSLFKPGSKINQDHKYKYIHILAYAASVVETWKKVQDEEKEDKRCLIKMTKLSHSFHCLPFSPPE